MSESTSAPPTDDWTETFVLRDGTNIVVRPIRPSDEALMAAFVQTVSAESARNRFHARRSQPAAPEIYRFTHIEPGKEIAFIAIAAVAGCDVQTGVIRYCVDENESSAEFALLIADDWQRKGIARRLLSQLVSYAKFAGLESLHGVMYSTNDAMLKLARKEGFDVSYVNAEPTLSEMRKRFR